MPKKLGKAFLRHNQNQSGQHCRSEVGICLLYNPVSQELLYLLWLSIGSHYLLKAKMGHCYVFNAQAHRFEQGFSLFFYQCGLGQRFVDIRFDGGTHIFLSQGQDEVTCFMTGRFVVIYKNIAVQYFAVADTQKLKRPPTQGRRPF